MIFDDRPIDKQTTPIEAYNVFSGSLSHPRDQIDEQLEYHDNFMIDLQPSRDAARSERLQREARAEERKRDQMRERAGEQHGHIRKTIPAKKEPDVLMITGNRKLSDPAKAEGESRMTTISEENIASMVEAAQNIAEDSTAMRLGMVAILDALHPIIQTAGVESRAASTNVEDPHSWAEAMLEIVEG